MHHCIIFTCECESSILIAYTNGYLCTMQVRDTRTHGSGLCIYTPRHGCVLCNVHTRVCTMQRTHTSVYYVEYRWRLIRITRMFCLNENMYIARIPPTCCLCFAGGLYFLYLKYAINVYFDRLLGPSPFFYILIFV